MSCDRATKLGNSQSRLSDSLCAHGLLTPFSIATFRRMFTKLRFIKDSLAPQGRPSLWIGLWLTISCIGCGSTKQNTATEQLLMSNAIDATISKLDFSPLTNKKVFLDTTYVNKPTPIASPTPQPMTIDANYVVSSIRQQMFAYGVYLVDNKDDAEIIAEPRVGALGLDGHDVTYGVPASSALSSASSAVSGAPLIPAIPELSVARKEDRLGAAKVAVFAYDRKSRQPVWQSGVAQSNSDSKSTWVLGIGPFQRGSIRSGTQFAGTRVSPNSTSPVITDDESLEEYLSGRVFEPDSPLVKHASHDQSSLHPTSPNQSASAQAAVQTPAGSPASGTSPAAAPTSAAPATSPPPTAPPPTTPKK